MTRPRQRTPSSSARTSGPAKATLSPTARRSPLLVLIPVLLAASVVYLAETRYRSTNTHERLYLADNVELTPPPALPGSDIETERSECAQLKAARDAMGTNPNNYDH